jgi:hypothetical protein
MSFGNVGEFPLGQQVVVNCLDFWREELVAGGRRPPAAGWRLRDGR